MDDPRRQTHGKLEKIKKHLELTAGFRTPPGPDAQEPKQKITNIFKSQKRPGHKVGIFSLEKSEAGWLQTALDLPLFSDLVKKIRYSSFQDKKRLKKTITKSTFCIFYSDHHSWKQTSAPEKEDAMGYFEGKPMIVVIAGMEDSSDSEKRKILEGLSFIYHHTRDFILFSKLETNSIKYYFNKEQMEPQTTYRDNEQVHSDLSSRGSQQTRDFNQSSQQTRNNPQDMTVAHNSTWSIIWKACFGGGNKNNSRSSRHTHQNWELRSETREANVPSSPPPAASAYIHQAQIYLPTYTEPKLHNPLEQKVGIFSRSAKQDYSWMTGLLTSGQFRDNILSIEPCYISNSTFHKFTDAVVQCTFAILYHTKNRGRINVTDVTDSLYDWELEYLSNSLGRDNVIVVIDDLEDSSHPEKRRILENQPSIGRFSSHLLLVSRSDKADPNILLKKLKSVKQFRHPSDLYGRTHPPTPSKRYGTTPGTGQNTDSDVGGKYSTSDQPSTSEPRPSSRYTQGPGRPRSNSEPQSEINYDYSDKTRPDMTIFSIQSDRNTDWLRRELSSEIFGHKVVSFHLVSLYDDKGIGDVQCRSGIIYHNVRSMREPVTRDGRFIYLNVLKHLSERLGSDNVMVVVDDLEVTSDREKMRILEMYPSIKIWARDLLLIPHWERDKTPYLHKIMDQLHHRSDHHHHQHISLQPRPKSCHEVSSRSERGVGIFLALEKDNCDWLRKLLISEEFGIKNVTLHSLAPNQEQIRQAALQCRFAIIYHSEKTGGIPVINEREYLYHEVLEQLSAKLRKRRVMVVIDDMSNSTDEVKSAILKSQPSFRNFATEVFLFSKMDKIYLQRPNNEAPPISLPVYEKLKRMKEILTSTL